MITLDALQTILTSGATIAMLKIVETIIAWVLERKKNKQDRADGKTEKDEARRDREISEIKTTVDVLCCAQKVDMRDRIKYLGRRFVKAGEISYEDREDLTEMHDAYHALGGNGHLDALMGDVMKLPLKH